MPNKLGGYQGNMESTTENKVIVFLDIALI